MAKIIRKKHIAMWLILCLLLTSITVVGAPPHDEGAASAHMMYDTYHAMGVEDAHFDIFEEQYESELLFEDLEVAEDLVESELQAFQDDELYADLAIAEEVILNGEYVDGEVIIVLPPSYDLPEILEVLEDIDAIDEDEFTSCDILTESMVVGTVAEGSSIEEAIAELRESSDVLYVQPNYIYRTLEEYPIIDVEALSFTPNDPRIGSQWANMNSRMPATWSFARADQKVAIAILDTGIRATHEDLAANIIPGSYFDVTPDGNQGGSGGDPPMLNVDGHGTHVAGVAAAVSNNSRGISGSSYNARIVPIKVFRSDGQATTVDLVNAYNRLLTTQANGATLAQIYNVRVINLSLGSTQVDVSLQNVITQAYNAGILTVAAAGNRKDSVPMYPASFSNVLSVAGLRQGTAGSVMNDVFDDSYSSFGDTIDVSAPGTNIISTSNSGDNTYSTATGTSFAAPFVSGVAALLFTTNPGATAEQVKNTIQSTAVDLGSTGKDIYYGWGQVNPLDAVWAIASKSIRFGTATGVGQAISCSVETSLPVKTTWSWSVSPTDGIITADGILTPKRSGLIQVTASHASNTNYKITGTVNVPYTTPGLTISSQAHVQNIGWMSEVSNGNVLGTFGRSLRVEAIRMFMVNNTGYAGGISYSTHVENIGWMNAVSIATPGNNNTKYQGGDAGTSGRSLRMEAFTMELTGELASYYDIYYRAHVQNIGWLGWASNGARVGSAGMSLRMEALQILVVAKGSTPPGSSYNGVTSTTGTVSFADPNTRIDQSSGGGNTGGNSSNSGGSTSVTGGAVSYSGHVHVQNIGDVRFTGVTGSTFIGTQGQSLRLEAININLDHSPVSGSLNYQVHIQNIGWQGVRTAGQTAGTSGQSLRLEAIRINLTGDLAAQYDVYYRTHVENIGWMGWAMNGQSAGSAGFSYRMEALQIVIVAKGGTAPGSNSGFFTQR